MTTDHTAKRQARVTLGRARLDLMQLAAHGVERGRPLMWRIDALTSVIEQADLMRAELIAAAREQGISWTEIGQNTGMTKQAAHKRWASPVRSESTDVDTEPLW